LQAGPAQKLSVERDVQKSLQSEMTWESTVEEALRLNAYAAESAGDEAHEASLPRCRAPAYAPGESLRRS
jgi:hypothetical protein